MAERNGGVGRYAPPCSCRHIRKSLSGLLSHGCTTREGCGLKDVEGCNTPASRSPHGVAATMRQRHGLTCLLGRCQDRLGTNLAGLIPSCNNRNRVPPAAGCLGSRHWAVFMQEYHMTQFAFVEFISAFSI